LLYTMGMKIPTYYFMSGGIGDFLQHLPFLIANKEPFIAAAHFQGAKELLDYLKLVPQDLVYFNTMDKQNYHLDKLTKKYQMAYCQRAQYFDSNPFEMQAPVFSNGKPVLGIHLGGSKFSIEMQKKMRLCTKNLPPETVTNLLSDKYNILLFGTEEEMIDYGLQEQDNLKFVAHKEVAKSLSYVGQCDAMIASDSSFKTMSSMLKIPTMVWMGDYEDLPRDHMFIDPYVKDGIMEVFRYFDINIQLKEAIEKSRNFLKNLEYNIRSRLQ